MILKNKTTMKTTNPMFDVLLESQAQFVNNWMDSARKIQSAFTSGNITTEGQHLYKEYFDKQMGLMQNLQQSASGLLNGNTENNPQEFFRNWFNQQAAYAKQVADFGQSIQNSYASFGKPAQDYMSNFGQSNTTFTNMYNTWLSTLNSSFDTLGKSMNQSFNKDVFSSFMQGNNIYASLQEFFQPMSAMFRNGQFNTEAFRQQFTPEAYVKLSKQMFGSFYNPSSVQDLYDNGMKQLQHFFVNQNNLGKEYYAQVQTLTKEFPKLFGENEAMNSLKDFYGQFHNVFGKTFEPLLKLVNAGKEKEEAENLLALMDRVGEYTIKQAELQSQLQNTAREGMEKIARHYADKYAGQKLLTEPPSPQDMYSEWIKINEQLFTDLFASDEFSKVKAEALSLGLEVKQHFEKQFERSFVNTPVVLKSEIEELHKTIYDLKKQVKDLHAKLSGQLAANLSEGEEDKQGRNRKK